VIDFAEVADQAGVVLDVRRGDEYEAGHIDGAVHIPLDEVLTRMDEIPDDVVKVHCASGFRASIAASLLDRAGRRVILIDDDFDNVAHAGLPMSDEEA
jgi:rhodanese-related sulfurtransferase